ncbi:hypothetical protein QFC22_004470 [Naganishia vaughanmartiniae]|uniref:Uncharacterized protein n=1 Tax=Naganishia vaughanmartiniae TaxID=1424756 RepID=A0ACC2X207_9TREE|nr:hypothetical protein QFC22_004470 [Naganishia vaughanmartiniae]
MKQDDLDGQPGKSPVDLVHQLGVYVHSSPLRMDEFERIRAANNPETRPGLLPLKDIVTRWNSKEAAIARVLRLRATVEVYTTREEGNKCPRFKKAVFDALAVIQPSLKIFLNMTMVYQEVGAHAHRIIPDLIGSMDELTEIHNRPHISAARRDSSTEAVQKLQKYVKKFVQNKWVLAAFCFDPTVRDRGMKQLLTKEYAAEKFYTKTIKFIKGKMEVNQAALQNGQARKKMDEIKVVERSKRINKFASAQYQAGQQEITVDRSDPWACYNSAESRYATFDGELPLAYWKRMAQYAEMLPLAYVARDVLGLASSSASVERLFSQAGHVLGKKRGSLSARLLAKQVMLRNWDIQGFLTPDDLGQAARNVEPESQEGEED